MVDSPRTRRRRSLLRDLAGLSVAVSLAGCNTGQILGSESTEPTDPVETFLDGVHDRAYRSVTNALHTRSPLHRSLSEEQIETVYGLNHDLLDVRSRQESVAYVVTDVSFHTGDGGVEATYTFEVRREDEEWKLWMVTAGDAVPGTPATETPGFPGTGRSTDTEDASPTDVPEPQSLPFHEDFESALSAWTGTDERWGRSTDVSFRGEYSGVIDAESPVRTVASTSFDGGKQLTEVNYAWYERPSSYGGGLRVLDDQGEVEVGTATDNPQWVVDGADGVSVLHDGVGQETWVRTRLRFDWSAGSVAVTFEDTASDESASETVWLKRGRNVETIQLRAFTSAHGWVTDQCRMAWDEIRAEE